MTIGHNKIKPLISEIDINTIEPVMYLTNAGWVAKQRYSEYGEVLVAFSPEKEQVITDASFSNEKLLFSLQSTTTTTVVVTPPITPPVDVTAPSLSSWNLNLNSAVITLIFDEVVNKASVLSPANITINGTTSNTTLTTSTIVPGVNSNSISVSLSSVDLNSLILGTNNTKADTELNITSGFISDIAGNSTAAISAIAVNNFTLAPIDSAAPTLSSWTLDITDSATATARLITDESLSLFNADNLTITIEGTDINIDSSNTVSISGSQVDITFSAAQAALLHAELEILIGVVNTLSSDITLTATAAWATDNSLLPNTAAAITTGVNPLTFNAPVDAVAPSLSSWDLNLNAALVTLIFNEVVSKSSISSVSDITIDGTTSNTSLTTSTIVPGINSNSVIVNLSSVDLNSLIVGTDNTEADTELNITSGFISDIAGNSTAAISAIAVNNFTTAVIDTAAPTLSSWALDITDSSTATAQFIISESLSLFNADNLTITIEGSAVNIDTTNTVSISGSQVDITFSAAQAALLHAELDITSGVVNTLSSDITLAATAAWSTDNSLFPNTAAAITSVNPVFNAPADTIVPTLLNWDINLQSSELKLLMSEAVDKSTLAVSDISINSTSLTTSTVDSVDNSEVVISLSLVDKNAIVVATSNTSTGTTLTAATDWIDDIAGNSAVAITTRAVRAYTPDGTVDSVKPSLASWTLNITDTSTATAQFVVTESISAFDLSKLSIEVEGTSISVAGTQTINSAIVNVTFNAATAALLHAELDITSGVVDTISSDIALTATAAWSTDNSIIPNTAAAITTDVNPSTFTAPVDAVAPTLLNWDIGLQPSELRMFMSEAVDKSTLTISDISISGVSLTTSTVDTVDNSVIFISLSLVDKNAIVVATSNTSTGTTLSTTADWIADIIGNTSAAITTRAVRFFGADGTVDTVKPTLSSWTLNILSSSIATARFITSEDISVFDLSKLTIEVEGTSISLAGTRAINSAIVDITFSAATAALLYGALDGANTVASDIELTATAAWATDSSLLPNTAAAITTDVNPSTFISPIPASSTFSVVTPALIDASDITAVVRNTDGTIDTTTYVITKNSDSSLTITPGIEIGKTVTFNWTVVETLSQITTSTTSTSATIKSTLTFAVGGTSQSVFHIPTNSTDTVVAYIDDSVVSATTDSTANTITLDTAVTNQIVTFIITQPSVTTITAIILRGVGHGLSTGDFIQTSVGTTATNGDDRAEITAVTEDTTVGESEVRTITLRFGGPTNYTITAVLPLPDGTTETFTTANIAPSNTGAATFQLQQVIQASDNFTVTRAGGSFTVSWVDNGSVQGAMSFTTSKPSSQTFTETVDTAGKFDNTIISFTDSSLYSQYTAGKEVFFGTYTPEVIDSTVYQHVTINTVNTPADISSANITYTLGFQQGSDVDVLLPASPTSDHTPTVLANLMRDAINTNSTTVKATVEAGQMGSAGVTIKLSIKDSVFLTDPTPAFNYMNEITTDFNTSSTVTVELGVVISVGGDTPLMHTDTGSYSDITFNNNTSEFEMSLLCSGDYSSNINATENVLTNTIINTGMGAFADAPFTSNKIWAPLAGPMPAFFRSGSTTEGVEATARIKNTDKNFEIEVKGTLVAGSDDASTGTPKYISTPSPFANTASSLIGFDHQDTNTNPSPRLLTHHNGNTAYSHGNSIKFSTVEFVKIYKDGALDTDFSTNGIYTGPFTNSNEFIQLFLADIELGTAIQSILGTASTPLAFFNSDAALEDHQHLSFAGDNPLGDEYTALTNLYSPQYWTFSLEWQTLDTYVNEYTYNDIVGTTPMIPNSGTTTATITTTFTKTLASGEVVTPTLETTAASITNIETPLVGDPVTYFAGELSQTVVNIQVSDADFTKNSRIITSP